jgi:alanine-glyoxylate transaminase/serine-glyoxylate transaminase/serine-pyruvate transaminase
MAHVVPEWNPPRRILMGPGPSDTHPRVLAALARPTVGHLDPWFLKTMNEIAELLRQVFATRNEMTLAVSGTGSAGMETMFVNLLEPGDSVLIGVNGEFGRRMTDVARRCGAEVTTVESPFGKIIEADKVKEALKKKKFKAVALVHAETSTGVHQPMDEIAALVREHEALFVLDTVTSLGGLPVEIDKWGVDAVYSGTQKCLSCPPGLSPISFSRRATDALSWRKTRPQSWYLDMTMVKQYWGSERLYHHTAPINMLYGLLEALRIVAEEGLEARFARHKRNHGALKAGLAAMGLKYVAQEGRQLPMLNAVGIPEGVEDAKVRRQLLEEFGIEIGGGLGEFKGKAWRIGLMGETSRPQNVLLCLAGLEKALGDQGYKKFSPGAGTGAALEFYRADPEG